MYGAPEPEAPVASAVAYNPISGEEPPVAEPLAASVVGDAEAYVVRGGGGRPQDETRIANAIGRELADQEMNAVRHRRSDRRGTPVVYAAEVQFADSADVACEMVSKAQPVGGEYGVVEGTVAGDEKYARKLAEEEELRARACAASVEEERDPYRSGGYEVAEYKTGDYECKDYDVSEYKSVYDKK